MANTDRIKCLECGKEFKTLVTHLPKHRMTTSEYRLKWNVKEVYNKDVEIQIKTSVLGKKLKKHSKIELLKYVECKICNIKRLDLCQHLRMHHKIEPKEYKRIYNAEYRLHNLYIPTKERYIKMLQTKKERGTDKRYKEEYEKAWKTRRINNNDKHTEETKRKISISRKGKCAGDNSSAKRPEVRKKMSLAKLGKKWSEETKINARKRFRDTMFKKYQFKPTKPEIKVEEILKKLNINYEIQKQIKNRLYDFYIPEYNLIIEVDGRTWHIDNLDKLDFKDKMFKVKYKSFFVDFQKEILANQAGYKLIRIWEDEISKEKILEQINANR